MQRLNAFLVIVICGVFVAWSDEPSDQAARSPNEKDVQYWIGQLGDDQFLRRQQASERLTAAGQVSVPALRQVLQQGDLETSKRAIDILQQLASTQSPSNEAGAWAELNRLVDEGVASQASRAAAAVDEILDHRSAMARRALAAAGVFVGEDEFVMRASMHDLRLMVCIDERWRGDVEPLKWFRWLDNIEFACVKGDAIKPDVLGELVRMPDLSTIGLIDGNVDEETIRPLQSMSRIGTIEFRYVRLQPEIVDAIAQLPIRDALSLMGTGVPADRVQQMRMDLPGLVIDYKQGGVLGVRCKAVQECRVDGVIKDSAAEKGGMLAGDVIVKIDGNVVAEFADLQAAINQRLPGDEVSVKYLRGDTVHEIKVKLQKFSDATTTFSQPAPRIIPRR